MKQLSLMESFTIGGGELSPSQCDALLATTAASATFGFFTLTLVAGGAFLGGGCLKYY